MRLKNACIPCVLQQVLRLCAHLDLSQSQSDQIFAEALQRARRALHEERGTAPEFSQKLYRSVVRHTGNHDPYRQLKKEQNALVKSMVDAFRQQIAAANDPLFCAARLSLLGNIIDWGAGRLFPLAELSAEVDRLPLAVDSFAGLRSKLAEAASVLFIADNAGEAVLDSLFIEQILRFRSGVCVHYAVRSRPAINDVLLHDAEDAGLHRLARILPSGSAIAGTLVARCSAAFRKLFATADVVIAKGQGNLETLDEEQREVFFFLKVKCRPVAEHLGLAEGDFILANQRKLFDRR